MNIHFLRSPKPRSVVLETLYELLRARGFEVSESIPDRAAHDTDVRPAHDLYVLKARGPLALSFATMLHRAGARVLNNPVACATLLDKIVTTSMMRRVGIPTPRTWAVADPAALLTEEFAAHLPLVVKPYDGIHSRDLQLVTDREALGQLRPWNGPMLVQEFIEGCRHRFKIHGVGERVFASRKRFSMGGQADPPTQVDPGDELGMLARRCGRLFGLVLYGLDVLIGPNGPVVVDLNSFPGYGGIREAPEALADRIGENATGRLELAPR